VFHADGVRFVGNGNHRAAFKLRGQAIGAAWSISLQLRRSEAAPSESEGAV